MHNGLGEAVWASVRFSGLFLSGRARVKNVPSVPSCVLGGGNEDSGDWDPSDNRQVAGLGEGGGEGLLSMPLSSSMASYAQ